jgi:hypothetical protein
MLALGHWDYLGSRSFGQKPFGELTFGRLSYDPNQCFCSTIDLLIEVACFVTKVKKIFNF